MFLFLCPPLAQLKAMKSIAMKHINFGAKCADKVLNIPSFSGGGCLQFKLQRMRCS